jgi:ABC-type glycerol-3-phosphate transport system substrate-binding protein
MDAPDRSRPTDEVHRRTFLKTAGAAGLGAAAGIEGILAARRAPAFAQATKVHLLQWVDFIPEGDVELRRQAAEYSKQAKVEVTVETINANDLQARITAAIQSGTGADIIMMLHNWPHLYAAAWPTSRTCASGRRPIRAATTPTRRPRRSWASAGSPCRIRRGPR